MKTFAEFLPDLTAREREIVESFYAGWSEPGKARESLELLRATPPANEPECFDGEAIGPGDTFTNFYFRTPPNLNPGDRVRVVKIEGAQ